MAVSFLACVDVVLTPPEFVIGGSFYYQGISVAPIKALVRSHVKESVLLSNVGAEVSFQLPNDASPSFKDMLLEMDTRKEELGINR